jgi:hypothetical protein
MPKEHWQDHPHNLTIVDSDFSFEKGIRRHQDQDKQQADVAIR